MLYLSGMRDRFGIFGTVIRNKKLSLLLVMTLRMPNSGHIVGLINVSFRKIEFVVHVKRESKLEPGISLRTS